MNAPVATSPGPRSLVRLTRLLRPYRSAVLLSFAAMIFACLGFLALPLLAKQVLSEAIHLRKMAVSPGLGLLVVAGFLVLAGSGYLSSILLFRVAHELTARLRLEYVEHLLNAPVAYHRDASTGETIQRLTASIADIEWFVKYSLGSLLGVVILMSGGAAMLFLLNWKLAVFSALAAPVIALGLRWIDRRARDIHRRRLVEQDRLIARLHGLLAGIDVVKAFNAAPREVIDFENHQKRLLEVQRDESRVSSLMEPLLITLAALTFIFVLFYGGGLIASGDLAPEELITFLIYLVFVIPNARNLALQVARWRHVNVALDRLDEAAAITPERDIPGAAPLATPVRGEIEFEGVTHSYPQRGFVIKNLSFRVAPGERVGIVGESGTGKSTLFGLLLRFYLQDHGTIRIDSCDTRHATLRSLRDATAVVPQDIVLFEGSVIENVRYGNPAASEEQVRAACKAARVDAFITSLPEGYHTQVGERGLKFSGGERQRLSIARALLKEAPILLMDEATSSLDARTEHDLRLAVEEVMRGRTTLIIAHRLATVVDLPRILVLDRGSIVDQGTHDELLNRCADYRTFVATQLVRQ